MFFNKVTGLQPSVLLKGDPRTDVFLWILRSFEEHLRTSASALPSGFCRGLPSIPENI